MYKRFNIFIVFFLFLCLAACNEDYKEIENTGGLNINGVLQGSTTAEDDAYDAGTWNGDLDPASKNAIRDKIETLAGGHDAVTLGADAAVILDLSIQEIDLDSQNANKVFAGPITGADADPTFRALVAGDIPDLSGTYLTAESDPAALLTAGTDNVKDTHIDWGTGAGQVSADDIPDGSTNAIPTLTQESNWDTAYGWGDHGSAGYESHTSNDFDPDRLSGDTVDDDKIAGSLLDSVGVMTIVKANDGTGSNVDADTIDGLDNSAFEPSNSNNIDPDRLAGDTVNDDLIDGAILGECSNSKGALPTTNGITDGYVPKKQTDGSVLWAADSTGAGGDQLVDLVATSPLLVNGTTNVNDALPGADADITFSMPAATNAVAGYMTAAMVQAVEANSAKNTNVSTALSVGTVDASTVSITSDGGADDVTLPAATNSTAGVATAAHIQAIEANTAKNTNVPTALSVGTVGVSTVAITSDGGADDVTLPAATNAAAGVATAAQITALEAALVNPMTTAGDIIYGGASGTPTRLASAVSGGLIQQAVIEGLSTAGSASPGFTAYDSDSPGADKTAGFIGWQYVDGADGSENSDWLLQIMQAGSLTTVLSFDESDDWFETTKVINSSGGFTGNLTGNASGSAGSVAVGNITGAGTGVLTALAVNVGSAGAPVLYNGALGTPSGGTLTNCTGLPAAGLTAGSVYTATASKSAAYTIGTDDAKESYGGVIYVTSAATITMPAVVVGMSFDVVTIGAIAVSLDTNASDRMYLDGVALDDGDKATNTSTTGDIIHCAYESAAGWYCGSGSPDGDHWTDGGP